MIIVQEIRHTAQVSSHGLFIVLNTINWFVMDFKCIYIGGGFGIEGKKKISTLSGYPMNKYVDHPRSLLNY